MGVKLKYLCSIFFVFGRMLNGLELECRIHCLKMGIVMLSDAELGRCFHVYKSGIWIFFLFSGQHYLPLLFDDQRINFLIRAISFIKTR